jgi:homoserine dehydrogenase
MSKELNIGLFGFGCVGEGLYEVLEQTTLINASIKRIVVKNIKQRSIAETNFSYDAADILEDTSIDTVVELIDDADAAYDIVIDALRRGKNVVSANKKLIANHLEELKNTAKENGASFLYEASVCASIPIIRTLEEYYNTDSIQAVEGICNGTTNYIFSQTDQGKSYEEALSEAQELGFAESDPTLDVDGFDAKFKLCILIKHAFGLNVNPEEIFNYGIRHVKNEDVQYGKEKGYRLKLLSSVFRDGNKLTTLVAPQFVQEDHPTYNVHDSFNAVAVKGLFSDQQTLVGRGAGAHPTASAVLSDISALQYEYKYEYKKEAGVGDLLISDEKQILVYIGSVSSEALKEIRFDEIVEEYSGNGYHYKTGYISITDLKSVDFNNRPDLFLALLPLPKENKLEALDYEELTHILE